MTDRKFGWMKRLAYAACALVAATAMSGCDPEFADSLAESLATQTPTLLSTTEKEKIVFERKNGLQPDGIWISNPNGTEAKQIVAFGDSPDLSQDGTKIVYRRGTSELWTAALKSPTPVMLFKALGFVSAPTWSPDGRSIAFVQDRGKKQVYIIRADAAETGAEPERVTGVKTLKESGRFFADNQVPRNLKQTKAQARVNPRAESTVGFQEMILTLSGSANNFDPAFSPDGKFIVFVSDRVTVKHAGGPPLGSFNNNEIYKIRLSDQEETRLTDKTRELVASERSTGTDPFPVLRTLSSPAFSPDGNFIVLSSNSRSGAKGGVFRIDANHRGADGRGTNARNFFQLTNETADIHPSFSPNGARIALGRSGAIFTTPNDNFNENSRPLTRVTAGNYPSWGKVTTQRFGYAVTGRVKTTDGKAIPGASVALTGGIAGKFATPSATGFYSFAGVPSGTYTLTVSASGYSFSQPSQTVVINEAPDTGNDFIGSAKTFVIQGFIRDANNRELDGVKVTLRNGVSSPGNPPQTTTSARGGFYQFERVVPGTYTLSVDNSQFSFTTPTRTVNVTNADVKNQDFKAAAQKFSISGTVVGATDANFSIAIPTGATFVLLRTSNGYNYTIGGVTPGTYILRPTSTKYDFTPTSLSVVVGSANVTGKNFTATLKASKFSVSGTISGIAGNDFGDTAIAVLRGTTFILRTPVTSANYVIPDLAPGSYTLAPVSTKYNFTPDTLAVTVVAANVTGKNFTASLKPAVTTVTLQPISGLTASVVKRSRDGADINPGLFIAGDHDLDGDNDSRPDGVIQGFVSYDTSAIPPGATIQSATFSARQNPSLFEGDPYGVADSNTSLGSVYVERARYDSINGSGQTPLGLSSLNEGALLPNNGTPPNTGARLLSSDGREAVKTTDVTGIVQLLAAGSSGRVQFRLRFATNSNGNAKVDFADFTPGSLTVKYSGGTPAVDTTAPTVAVTSPKNGEPLDARGNLILQAEGVAGTASDNVGVVKVNVVLQRNAVGATFPDGFYNWKTKVFDNQFNIDSITPARSTDGFRTWKAANTDAMRFPNLEIGRTYSVNAEAFDAAGNSTTRGSQFVRANATSSAVLATITLGGVPEQVAVNEKTNRIYVARAGGVDVISGDTNAIVARVALSNFPRSIAVNTATNKIYVGGFSNVSVIDGATNTVLSILQQFSVLGVAVNPDPDKNPATNDSRIYTTDSGQNPKVSVFNGADDSLITQITVGTAATRSEGYGIDINPVNNKVYVAIFGNDVTGATTGGVAVINGATNTVIKTITTDLSTVDVAVNPTTNKIYVTSRSTQGIRVINGATDTLAGEVNLGRQTENAAVNPVTNRVYVSAAARVVNGQNDTFLGFYNLGTNRSNSDGVAVNSLTNRVYFSNSDSTLSVIDGSVAPAPPGSTPN